MRAVTRHDLANATPRLSAMLYAGPLRMRRSSRGKGWGTAMGTASLWGAVQRRVASQSTNSRLLQTRGGAGAN